MRNAAFMAFMWCDGAGRVSVLSTCASEQLRFSTLYSPQHDVMVLMNILSQVHCSMLNITHLRSSPLHHVIRVGPLGQSISQPSVSLM
ncbi:hypothetical protein QQF64_006226 [Cirrhinus molitorella]|uniref:Secreted protein n=1 Tax=Cirrhinus molitorella TaxID=172907 RepID=A0ABR3MHR2_9TELE